MHLSPLAYIYLYTINIGRGEATHGNAEISKQRNMEILFGLFIIVLIVILVKVFRSKPEQTEPEQLYTPPTNEDRPMNDYANYLRFNIAGINYRKRIKDYVGNVAGYVDAEPTNKYDPNAIAVYAKDGHHLGYIPEAETYEVRELGLPFPINAYCEIEEEYDYEESRRFFIGHVLIEIPEKETPAQTCAGA